MFRKSLIAAAVLAISPAIAFAAPMTTATTTAKPAITQSVKAEKVKVVKTHRAAKKVKVTAHLHLKAKPKVNKV
jgi:hypothetical protein